MSVGPGADDSTGAGSGAHDAPNAAPAPGAGAVDERLRRLEAEVETLSQQLAALRAELRAERADPRATPGAESRVGGLRMEVRTGAPPPRAAAGGAAPARGLAAAVTMHRKVDLEALVGRYGTLLLGALTVVLGVGAFLSWAVQRVELGPGARVALGAAGAGAVAALGLWLRARGTRRFGNVLLALALALVHVVAWGAGPGLGVVPPAAALAVAAAASLALAALAWHDGEQPLFVVGVGGALLAPFVTASETGDPLALLGYGWLVLAAAVAALRERRWRWAVRLLVTGALAYAGVALDAPTTAWTTGLAGDLGWVRRVAPALFVLAAAWAALLLAGRAQRSGLTRQLLLVMLVPLLWRGTLTVGATFHGDLVALAAAGLVTLYLALRLRDADQPLALPSALAQPLLLLGAALTALPQPLAGLAAAVAAGAAALALLAAVDAGAWRAASAPPAPAPAPARGGAAEPLWSAHLLVAALASALALALAFREAPVLVTVALAAQAAGVALLARRLASPLLVTGPVVVLACASIWAADLLQSRPAYAYTPFLTRASAAMLAVAASWWVTGYAAASVVRPPAAGPTERALLRAAGPTAAFLWGVAELGRAVSPEMAAFLLILYFAAGGVLLILLGRRYAMPGGRRIGLALAVFAALKAMAEASDFEAVGLRVGSYLLVGGFLLAVAYWYRAAGEPESDASADAGTAADAADADDASTGAVLGAPTRPS